MQSIRNPGKSYSPEANKELISIKMHKKSKDRKFWLFSKMEHLYNCKNKLKVNVLDKNKHEIDINFVEEYILNKLE